MQLDSSIVVNTLTGKPYQGDGEDLIIGKVIAESLATDQTGGKMKMYALAEKCYSGDIFEVDVADLILMKKSVEECKSYNNIILGQTLLALEAVK